MCHLTVLVHIMFQKPQGHPWPSGLNVADFKRNLPLSAAGSNQARVWTLDSFV
jgi:hypothetical protein